MEFIEAKPLTEADIEAIRRCVASALADVSVADPFIVGPAVYDAEEQTVVVTITGPAHLFEVE